MQTQKVCILFGKVVSLVGLDMHFHPSFRRVKIIVVTSF